MINTKYFETREKLDALYSEEYPKDDPVTKVERISLAEALKFLTVTISSNMEYYLSNWDEMEKDLGRSLNNLDVNNEDLMQRLEAELFYNQAIKIFGEDVDGNDNITKEESAGHETVKS